jgi:AcrR family transcriptional regulator
MFTLTTSHICDQRSHCKGGTAMTDRGERSGDKAPADAERRYHHGDLRRALLDAAEALLAEGEAAPGLRAVARRAGVSHAAPYRHFADRAALLAAVAARGFRELADRMAHAAAAAGDARARLAALGEAYVGFALDRPAAFRLMFGPQFAGGRGGPELQAAQAEAFELLARAVAELRGGAARDPEVRQAAVAAWGLAHGLAQLLIDGRAAPAPGQSPLALAASAMRHLELVR